MGKSPLFLFSFFGIQQNHHVFCFRLSCWTVFLGPESTWNFHNIGIRRGRFWYGWSPDMWEEHYGMTREKNMAKNIRWLCMKIDENRFSNRYISCIGLYWIICIYILSIYYIGRISENGLGRMILYFAHLLLESHSGLPSSEYISAGPPSSWVCACFALSKIHGPLDVGCSFIHTSFELYTAYMLVVSFVMDNRWFTMRQLVNNSGCQAVI